MQLHELSLRQTEHIAIYGGFDGSSVRGDLLEIDPGELTWSFVRCPGTGCTVKESLLLAGSPLINAVCCRHPQSETALQRP